MHEEFEALRKGYMEARCRSAVQALRDRGFEARWFGRSDECMDEITRMIPAGSRVGAGGSVTIRESGLLGRLRGRGDSVLTHEPGMSDAECLRAWKEAGGCPYYLTSSNAITMQGELVNVDQVGNRVAAMVFGPQTVVVMAGANKLVQDRDEALARIRGTAAPADALKLGFEVPCVASGQCEDCRSRDRLCRVTTIISFKPMMTDMKIFLVAEKLGF
jgi:hypothetical protein